MGRAPAAYRRRRQGNGPPAPPGLVEPGDPAPTVGPDAGTTFAALQGAAARLERWCAALIDRPETMPIYGDEHYLDTAVHRIIASNEHYTAGTLYHGQRSFSSWRSAVFRVFLCSQRLKSCGCHR